MKFVNLNEEGFDFTAMTDENGTVTFDDFRKGEYNFSVTLDGFNSNFNEEPVSIWSDTTFEAILEEIFAPISSLEVSGTGYAHWTDMLPHDERVAERYHVTLDGVFQGETTDNFMQLNTDDLTIGQTYTAAVAVVYTTGWAQFVDAQFEYTGCAATATQVNNLAAGSPITREKVHSGFEPPLLPFNS